MSAALRNVLMPRSRLVIGGLAAGEAAGRMAGAHADGRMHMYVPMTYEAGSAISHFATEAKPNRPMEPAIHADLEHTPTLPRDLTLELLKDIGW